MKRIVTIQDISCVGRCSLTVALPIISAMGIETAVLPTAVLSNHTAFPQFTIHDLTDEFSKITGAWNAQGIGFDGVYSGYLASNRQIGLVDEFMQSQHGALRFVDPAMADHGKLYYGFDAAFARRMAGLCANADVIVPNLTEAAIMTGIPYREETDGDYYKELAKRLADRGATTVVLTGYTEGEHSIGAIAYDRERGEFQTYVNDRLPTAYHGTGDIFASTMFGALMRDHTLEQAMTISVNYVLECMRCTAADPEHRSYGVNYEQAIPYLVSQL